MRPAAVPGAWPALWAAWPEQLTIRGNRRRCGCSVMPSRSDGLHLGGGPSAGSAFLARLRRAGAFLAGGSARFRRGCCGGAFRGSGLAAGARYGCGGAP